MFALGVSAYVATLEGDDRAAAERMARTLLEPRGRVARNVHHRRHAKAIALGAVVWQNCGAQQMNCSATPEQLPAVRQSPDPQRCTGRDSISKTAQQSPEGVKRGSGAIRNASGSKSRMGNYSAGLSGSGTGWPSCLERASHAARAKSEITPSNFASAAARYEAARGGSTAKATISLFTSVLAFGGRPIFFRGFLPMWAF